MRFKKIIVSALTAATVVSGSGFTIDAAYAQSVSTKTTFSGDFTKFYAPAGKAVVAYDDVDKNGEIKYLELDNLQRAQGAYGYISKEMRNAAKERGRQDIKVDPVGWGNNEQANMQYDSQSYNGWFYNRSHLIADSLNGDPVKENLVTGTRMQNVGWGNGGMAYIEDKTRTFLDSPQGDNCPVYYAATPNYVGSELLPRTVTVNAKSCDNSIDEQIVVDNVAPGYIINYMNGNFQEGEIPEDQIDSPANDQNNESENTGDDVTNQEDNVNNDNQNDIDTGNENNTTENNTTEDTNTTPEQDTNTNNEVPQREEVQDNTQPSSSTQSQTQIGGGTQSQSENGIDTTDRNDDSLIDDAQQDINEDTDTSITPPVSDDPSNTSVSLNNSQLESPLQSAGIGMNSSDADENGYGPKVDTGGQVHQGIIAKIVALFK